MKKIVILSVIAFGGCSFFSGVSAQDCNCKNEFDFVKTYIEKNYAGFKDKVALYTAPAYDRHTKAVAAEVIRAKKAAYCMYLISKWLQFFKDGHIQIGYNGNIDINDSAVVQKLVASTEKIKLSPKKLNKLSIKKNVEGIYWYRDSAYKVAITGSVTPFRDYAAVIVESKNNMWKPGMIKFELKQTAENKFDCIFYYRDHHAQLIQYRYDEGVFNDGEWFKEGIILRPGTTTVENTPVVQGRLLSDQTFYIRIRSFDEQYGKEIDSLFRADTAKLNHLPNLILDLRGNGGGSDFTFSPIIPYLYTNAITTVGADVLATKDNIESWRPLLASPHLPEDTREWIQKLIAKMENNIDSFVSTADDETMILTNKKPYPKKIVVLTDKGCASTTEQFLLSALQSKKVTLMGQSTHGVLDYANMRDIKLASIPYTLSYATTRSRRVPGKAIDNKGIQPHIDLTGNKDWIQAAMQYLEQ